MTFAPGVPSAIRSCSEVVRYEPIGKTLGAARVSPNLLDYDAARRAFSWDDERAALVNGPDGGLNIADACVDRHARGARRDHLAIRWLGRHGDVVDLSYAELSVRTSAFAEVLDELDVGRGGRVFVLLGRAVELYVAVIGTLKHGSVACTLFSAFGPEPIRQRMSIGDADVLVTTEALYRRKVAPIRDALPTLRHVLVTGADAEPPPGTIRLDELMAAKPGRRACAPTAAEDMALLHFTSGTTGTPKGAVHVHDAVVAHAVTGKLALDFHDTDVFWCTADPGWVTGTSYGIIAPLVNGITSIVDEGEFDAERWYGILQSQHVNVWYTAPTAVRMMMKAGAEAPRGYDLSALRFIASVGEPLNPEAVCWGERAFGLPIHDNWWQTETGGIMIANFAATEIRPGSMGRPLPGVEAAILRRDEHGEVVVHDDVAVVVDDALAEGELALRPGWPSMFRGYLHDDARYQECFVGGWYRSGDLAMRDADGYYWFVGRADDVIKSAGHLIGPFEVESALMEHPAVAEAAVIGAPDPIAGEIVKAFVVPRQDVDADEALRRELIGFGRSRLGAAVAPRDDRVRRRPAEDAERQDHAPHVARSRAWRRRRRHVDARSRRAVGGCGADGMSTRPSDTVHALDLYREMLRIRRFEERCVELYSASKIRGFLHLYVGEEAVAVGVMQALTTDDAVVATYREHGHALARGIPADVIMAEMFGKVEGCSRGRGGSMHLFDVGTRFFGGNAIVGGGLPVAVGLALADQMQGRPRVTACFFGEGAVAEGEFHESLNLAALWNLPVLFCCENNLYAMGTALTRSESETDLALKAASYEMPAWSVDGMDVLQVEASARRAADAVRGGGGPHFLEFRTYRFRAHSMYDPELYREKSEVEQWKTRDPLELLRNKLVELDAADDQWWETADAEVTAEIDEAVAFAERGTLEPIEDLTRFVYHEVGS